jgi:hypothetical protein
MFSSQLTDSFPKGMEEFLLIHHYRRTVLRPGAPSGQKFSLFEL